MSAFKDIFAEARRQVEAEMQTLLKACTPKSCVPPPSPTPDPLVRACLDCRGTGVWHEDLNAIGSVYRRQHCPYCNGTGRRQYPHKQTERWG